MVGCYALEGEMNAVQWLVFVGDDSGLREEDKKILKATGYIDTSGRPTQKARTEAGNVWRV